MKLAGPRAYHEERVADNLRILKSNLETFPTLVHSNCEDALMRFEYIARGIALARAHVASIETGPGRGPRTRKLWGAVGRSEKLVEAARKQLQKTCLR